MESYSTLLEAFEALNQRKRSNPENLSDQEMSKWMELRREIEELLFASRPESEFDSRQFLRVPVSLAVRYWTRNELKDRYIPVLGEGGLFVSTEDPLAIGSEIGLEIVLEQKGLSFQVEGQVVWVDQSEDPTKRGMGIKFQNMTYEQMRNIYSLVDDTLRQRLLERRRFARIETKLQVDFVFAEGKFELLSEDLSLGGMFIATDHLVPVGEKIRLVLHLPGKLPTIKVVAEVVRVLEEESPGQPAGLGVRFVNLEQKGLQAIRSFLGARVASEFEQSDSERRRFPRIERLVKLKFQAMESFSVAFARDISKGGVFIHTPDPPPLGTELSVVLVHPITQQKAELSGRVVRMVEADGDDPRKVPGVGVVFNNMDESQQSFLREFLKDFALLDNNQAIEKLENGSD